MHDPAPDPVVGPHRGSRGRDRQLAAQYAVTRILADSDDFDSVAPRLLESLCVTLRWQAAAVWIQKSRSSGRLSCAAVWVAPGLDAWREATSSLELDPGVGLPGRVWVKREAVWIEDLIADGNFVRQSTARRVGLRHGVAFPIILRGDVYAVVECFGRRIRGSDANLVAFFDAVGRQLSAFLERLETRRALEASEARKTGILEAAVDAIVSADEHGRILDFNPAAERLFGRDRADVLGRRIAELIVPPELRPRHREGLRRYVRTRVPHILGRRIRTDALRADGTTVEVELTVTEIDLRGRPMFTAFIRDVTDQRQAEIARDRFLEILSHELRTPVTAIYGGSRILARPGLAPDSAAALLDDIGAEADRLYRLVEDLMILARAERGALEVALEPVHLDRVVERMVASTVAHLPGLSIAIQRTGDGRPVLGEESYLEQILRNFLSNAAKYAATGGIEVRVEYMESEARVLVLDSGPGVRTEEAARLFEIDYRSPLTEGAAQGSGIGLFVARWLAEVMGGRVWARRRPEGGSEFGFALRAMSEFDESGSGSAITLAVGP